MGKESQSIGESLEPEYPDPRRPSRHKIGVPATGLDRYVGRTDVLIERIPTRNHGE